MKDKWSLCNCFRNKLNPLPNGGAEMWGLDCTGYYCDDRVTCGKWAEIFNRREEIRNEAKEAVKR